jgi:hypothetical protein
LRTDDRRDGKAARDRTLIAVTSEASRIAFIVVLGEAAARPDDLSVDPTPIGTGEKRDGISGVVRLSKPLHRCDFA